MDENLSQENLDQVSLDPVNPDNEIILDPPVINVQEPLPEPHTYVNVPPEEVEKYRELVVHYFDNQMNYDIMRLQGEDKNRMFQMLTDYADVLEKILHDGIPILEHIQDKRWAAAHANPHTGINWEHSCPIIAEYEKWKKEKEESKPTIEDEPAQS